MIALDPAPNVRSIMRRDPTRLLQIVEEIYYIKDLDTLLEKVLFEARKFVNAEAGTIYSAAGRYLYFSYVQNDALFREDRPKDKYIYSSKKLLIDKNSLAGYVAATGDALLVDDVYDISSNVTYHFNPDFDRKTAYKTESILVVPLETTDHLILGVLQLINAKNENGLIIPFSMQDRLYITEFARNAANAIEKAKLSREMVLRMVELAQLRDPYETSQHAKRVGASSIELYKAWALGHRIADRKIKHTVEVLRNAAILHDVGKVALSDVILKKPGGLGKDEIIQMKSHTIHGARLFRYVHSPWDRMAAEVALNHHERWDGRGYPGKIDNIFAREIRFGPGKRGKEIPLEARIVALADVYDALMSKRSYKDSWKEEQALRYIRVQSGRQFDPELVAIFLRIYRDTIRAIRQRYV
jgi:HD-GYP domain-containing protein (c-di-GMP phosphodiesterase class II)